MSLRPYLETQRGGYLSPPDQLSLDNYRRVWDRGALPRAYWNTALILVPALSVTLALSSMIAFAASRFRWRYNVALLALFTAGGMLPQQIIINPLRLMYSEVPLPDALSNSGSLLGSTWGIIIVHIAYQSGFATFVLSNYMKTLPGEVLEAAVIDGASLWQQYRRIVLPMVRPALAALGALQFTWIYNDFFWALILEQQTNDRPVTSAIGRLAGGFARDNNVIAAVSILMALPPLIVFVFAGRHLVNGFALARGIRQEEGQPVRQRR
ncbi:MAG: carbohydrate ABC transporter permease [Actinomycetota bacterium]